MAQDYVEECIFCQIGAGKSPANIEYSDNEVVVFWDINPRAPIHLLVTPKKHITSINDMSEVDEKMFGHMLYVAKKMAAAKEIAQDGYRLVINAGKQSGQIVDHVHLHVLGGQPLGAMNDHLSNGVQ